MPYITCMGDYPLLEMNFMNTVRRGDIYFADLSPVVGSEQGGMRPVLIIQNDTGTGTAQL